MSRTQRKKWQYQKAPTIGTDGPDWRDASDPEHVARRERAAAERAEDRGDAPVERVRRGRTVAVPAQWQGQVTSKQRQAQRRAKARNKVKDRRRKKRAAEKLYFKE